MENKDLKQENLEEKEIEKMDETDEKKKRKNTQFHLFMITQDLEHHIGKTPTEVNQEIEKRLGDNFKYSHTIMHDRCYTTEWDYQEKKYKPVLKRKHMHTVLKVNKKMTINAISEALDIPAQYIEKPKAGKNAEDYMLAYLIHAREPDKVLYEPNEVTSSNSAIPYSSIYSQRKKNWELDRAKKRTKQTEIETDDLIEKIEIGEIVDVDQILLTDEYYRCYSRNSTRIDKALEIASRRRQAQNVQLIKEGNLKQVIFITGAPRKGKSYLTDQITHKIAQDKNWLIGEGAISNCLDDYNGEEIFVLDDVRGSAMKAEEWTRLLDPRRANRGSARYHNKMMSPQLIIFNCYKDVDEFFYFTKGISEHEKSEAIDQFIGRILIRIVVHAKDDIDLSLSDEKPSERYLEIIDKDGYPEYKLIKTEHSFVTICEHQTNENIIALVSALICANQHSGKVTDAMMNAIATVNKEYNNVLLEPRKPSMISIEEYEKLKRNYESVRSVANKYQEMCDSAGLLNMEEEPLF